MSWRDWRLWLWASGWWAAALVWVWALARAAATSERVRFIEATPIPKTLEKPPETTTGPMGHWYLELVENAGRDERRRSHDEPDGAA